MERFVLWCRLKSNLLSRVNEEVRARPAVEKSFSGAWDLRTPIRGCILSSRLVPVLSRVSHTFEGMGELEWSSCTSLRQHKVSWLLTLLCVLGRLLWKQKALSTSNTWCHRRHRTKWLCACPVYELPGSSHETWCCFGFYGQVLVAGGLQGWLWSDLSLHFPTPCTTARRREKKFHVKPGEKGGKLF